MELKVKIKKDLEFCFLLNDYILVIVSINWLVINNWIKYFKIFLKVEWRKKRNIIICGENGMWLFLILSMGDC